MGKNRTKEITLSAMLTALSIVYIAFMPTLDFGLWSFTPLSHIFIMLGVFISPYVGLFTCVGTFVGFFAKGVPPLVLLRAGSHVFFVLLFVFMLKKFNAKKTVNLILICLAIGVVHAVAEVAVAYIGAEFLGFGSYDRETIAYTLFFVVGGGTLAHSIVDYFAAFAVHNVLERAKILPPIYGT